MTPDTRRRVDRIAVSSRPRRRALALGLDVVALVAQAGYEVPMPPGGRPWRIGWLLVTRADSGVAQHAIAAFETALGEHGWVRERHYSMALRWSEGDARRFPTLAGELVALQPDVLIAVETTALAFRRHTTTIPIVLWASLDPVAAGLVSSLAQPGGNVTGVSNVADGLTAKNVEALFELLPRARRIALLQDPGWAAAARQLEVAREVARLKGARLDAVAITTDAHSVEQAFRAFEGERPDALMIANNGATLAQAQGIRERLRVQRLPAAGLIEAGAVVRHSADVLASLREAADLVDRILRGAKPADLPVRQIKSVTVTLNLGLARELGIEVPASLRVRADEVIE
jgi:putative ABC transport system substrate-binding protein